MWIEDLIGEQRAAFVELCRSHNVIYIYAFGSSVTADFHPGTSDIDLLVSIDVDDPVSHGETLLRLWDALEMLFKRKVDLLTRESIRNPYLKSSIDRTKKLIYDREREEVLI